MRLRFSKTKNWKKAELKELKQLVNTMTNNELCKYFSVPITVLRNTMQKYRIKRDENILLKIRSENKSGENNPNWQGGISKDGARYSAIQRERYPARKHARDAVYRALKTGRLLKPERCEDCGTYTNDLQGHHESYDQNKWLEVNWLCRKCHRVWDAHLESGLDSKI
jgi:hypothetical protein